MRVASVRPEKEQSIKFGFNVSKLGFAFWKNSKNTSTYLGIPVFIKVIYTRDASSISIWIINMPYITCSIAWVTSNHSFRPAIDFVVAQLAITVTDQVVHAAHEPSDGFTAWLLAFDPSDLVAPNVLGGVALLADQLPVGELAGVVQGPHLLADLLASLLAQKVVHHADAVLVHAWHDVFQRQLQRRQGLRLPVGPQHQPQTRGAQLRAPAGAQRRSAQQLVLPRLRLSWARHWTLVVDRGGRRRRRRRGNHRCLGRGGCSLRGSHGDWRRRRWQHRPRACDGLRGGSVPVRRRRPLLLLLLRCFLAFFEPGPAGLGWRRGVRSPGGLGLGTASSAGPVLAAVADELVLLPVLALVLLAAIEGTAAAATAQQVLHLSAQLAVLPVPLARAQPAGAAAVIGHGGGGRS